MLFVVGNIVSDKDNVEFGDHAIALFSILAMIV